MGGQIFNIMQGSLAVAVLSGVVFMLYAAYICATTIVERVRAAPRPRVAEKPQLRLVKTEPKPEPVPEPIVAPDIEPDAEWLKDFG
ncbi:MAG TPA: hypothetical protein VG889_16585 [Rhizomicrobium sp.]|nr:hypothetical protein [Rhizomicrobium sp.]